MMWDYSRHFAPTFEELANYYASLNNSRRLVKFAAADCTIDRALCTMEGITGYPGKVYIKMYT